MQTIFLPFARALVEAICSADKRLSSLATEFESAARSSANTHLAMHDFCAFFDQARLQTGDEDLGLLAYEKAHPSHLGILGYAVMSSSTLVDAMTRLVEHHNLIGTGFCMFLDQSETTVRIAGLSAGSENGVLPRAFIDAATAITLGLLRWLTHSASMTPVKAEFTYKQPRDIHKLEQLFGPNLKFSCAVNAMTFERCDAELTVATSDQSLQQIHDHYLKRHQEELQADGFSAQVKSVLTQHLNQGKSIAMEQIAQTLGLSIHQLDRGLDKDHESFQKLVDSVRKQISHHMLVNTELSYKHISYSIGFKHSSAFNKACERWFGMPPSSYRANRTV